ncbi:uncharacterized protein LOC120705179 [Panicum virgatum]|uniref:uncharacterized protein LOC120705179 n=1 Tax=Panicum virgatum TaxID=38727 RepID=UPI0019D5EA4A|nr:uncharacterized protein LOC120705179 [Panicum virgatum]
MEIEQDALADVALLRAQDSSGRYDDVIEMFSRLRQKAKRLVQVVTCRQTDDVILDRAASATGDRPPRPPMISAGTGMTVQLPRTPLADIVGPSMYQHATMSTPPRPFVSGVPPTGYPQPGFVGFNPSMAPGTTVLGLLIRLRRVTVLVLLSTRWTWASTSDSHSRRKTLRPLLRTMRYMRMWHQDGRLGLPSASLQ